MDMRLNMAPVYILSGGDKLHCFSLSCDDDQIGFATHHHTAFLSSLHTSAICSTHLFHYTMPQVPLLVEDGTPLDHSQWVFSQAKKGSKTTNSFINESLSSRKNPRFQMHVKLRVKHPPSPGEGKTIDSHQYERVNVECAVPRAGFDDVHAWFGDFDKRGIRQTYDNQELAWPNKRAKELEDILPEGLYRASIKDSPKMVENDYDPSLRLKAVPETCLRDGEVTKNRKPTRVYVVEVDERGDTQMREGVIADIEKGDEIVVSVDVENWWASKDGSGVTYTIDECAVYKPDRRPAECQLRIPGVTTSVKKRSRQETTDDALVGAGAKADAPVVKRMCDEDAATTHDDSESAEVDGGYVSEEEGF